MGKKILCINPGSTSTRIAVFEDREKQFVTTLTHSNEELEKFGDVQGQLQYRYEAIAQVLKDNGIDAAAMDAIVGRGGALRPMAGGILAVNEQMLEDCRTARYAEHPSHLGCQLAKMFADPHGLPCYVVDPPLVDEFAEESKYSGFAPLRRISAFHALNEKIVARYVAEELGRPLEQVNIITTHLGSGVSVTAHQGGRCIDNTYGSGGDGPFSPERAGRMPGLELLRWMAQDPDYKKKRWGKVFSKQSGLVSYFGTNDVLSISARMKEGDVLAREALDGFCFMIAKEIGGYAACLDQRVDAIGITGAIARSEYIVESIRRYVQYLAPVFVFPGEFEMEGLADVGFRALLGEESVKQY